MPAVATSSGSVDPRVGMIGVAPNVAVAKSEGEIDLMNDEDDVQIQQIIALDIQGANALKHAVNLFHVTATKAANSAEIKARYELDARQGSEKSLLLQSLVCLLQNKVPLAAIQNAPPPNFFGDELVEIWLKWTKLAWSHYNTARSLPPNFPVD